LPAGGCRFSRTVVAAAAVATVAAAAAAAVATAVAEEVEVAAIMGAASPFSTQMSLRSFLIRLPSNALSSSLLADVLQSFV